MGKPICGDAIRAIMPSGAAWEPKPGNDFDKIITSTGEIRDNDYDFLDDLSRVRNPYTTPYLEDLEREFGILADPNLTEAESRANLATQAFAKKTTASKSQLQEKLHTAGYTDLFVYDNDPVINPGSMLFEQTQACCGLESTVCGNELAVCAATAAGEYVVNGDIKIQGVIPTAVCGNENTVCGNITAVAGAFQEFDQDVIYSPGDGPTDTTPGAPYALIDGDMEASTAPDWYTSDLYTQLQKKSDNPYEGTRNLRVTNPCNAIDGDMEDSGTTAWTAQNSAVLTKETVDVYSGTKSLKIANTIGNPSASQTVLTAGKRYIIQGFYKSDGVSSIRIKTAVSIHTDTAVTVWTPFRFDIVADGTTIYFGGVTSTPGSYTLWDNICLVEVPNQIIDGDMEAAGTTAWTAQNGAGLTKDTVDVYSGTKSLKIANTVSNPSASQIVLTVGKRYRATGYYKTDGTNTIRIKQASTVLHTDTAVTVWTAFDFEFTADDTGIYFGGITSTPGAYTLWDNIYVSEMDINPVANHTIEPNKFYFLTGALKSDGISKPQIYNNDSLAFEAPAIPDWRTFGLEFFSTGDKLILSADNTGFTDWDYFFLFERTHNGHWNLVFFVGGVAEYDPVGRILSIDKPDIDQTKREHIRRIILRHKPLYTWGGLCVNFI